MSDCPASKLGSDTKSRESMRPYQSPWMAHWMQTSCDAAASRICEGRAIRGECEKEDLAAQNSECRKGKMLDVDVGPSNISDFKSIWRTQQGSLEVASNSLQFSEGVVAETRRMELTSGLQKDSKSKAFPIMKVTQSESSSFWKLSGSSAGPKNLSIWTVPYFINKQSEAQSISKFDLNQNMEMPVNTEWAICDREPSGSQIGRISGHVDMNVSTTIPHSVPRTSIIPPGETEFELKEHSHQAEDIVQSPLWQIKPDNYLDRERSPVLRSFQGNFIGLTSNTSLHGHKSMRPENMSCTNRREKKNILVNASSTPTEDERCSYRFFCSDKKMDKSVIANTMESLCSGQLNQDWHINTDPSAGVSHFPILVGEQSRSIKKFPFIRSLPAGNTTSQGVTALVESKCGLHFLHRMPTSCLHNLETLQMSTTADSMEEMPGGEPKFSNTTHHQLMRKKTVVDLSEEDKEIRESLFTEFGGNASHGTVSLPSVFHCYDKDDGMFQCLGNSVDCEAKVGKDAIKTGFSCMQNESSAETETMLIDVHHSGDSCTGATSGKSHKDVITGPTSPIALSSPRKEAGIRHAGTNQPDMNEELPVDLAQAGLEDSRESSTSRTQSLDVEHLLSYADQLENSNSSPQQGGQLGPDPSSRWVKRLRPSASDSLAFGTKSSKIAEVSSSGKVNKLFSRIMSYGRTNSEPTLGKFPRRGPLQPIGKAMLLSRNGESSSADSVKDYQGLNASYSWIRRWCRSRGGASQGGLTANVVSKQERSKAVVGDFQRKQYPSIAAMALMRKAVSNFHPCEFRKRGSLMVWNADGW